MNNLTNSVTLLEHIELLRDDEQYYHGIGREYFSNSDIRKVLEGTYTREVEERKFNPNFLFGSYVHTAILEPHKLKNFEIYDGTRREKAYKEIGKDLMTRNEQIKAQLCIDAINASREARGLLYGPNMSYEEPNIVDIQGVLWKGKADAINHDLKLVVDVKTTHKIDLFQSKATSYGYNSQAWLYWKLFGYAMAFVVVDKSDYEVYVVEPKRGFYQSGKERAYEAIEVIKANNYFR